MHQPFYKDLVTGEYRLPWTRLHALKDYFGMVKILEDFPEIRQTFNLVPSLLVQIEDYASGKASDPFLRLAIKPAESLSRWEKEFILRYSFQANEDRVIRRYPRYAELHHDVKRVENKPELAAEHFDDQMIRDLQILSQVAWFDEWDLEHDSEVKHLAQKGRDYNLGDQVVMAQKQSAGLARVLDVYREFANRGQIELSTSAYYHPILPLLCDSNIAHTSHPYVPLPTRFSYPGDAEEQIQRACAYMESKFGVTPRGLWPSEGSVSDATLEIAARLGFTWIATDDGVLARTLKAKAAPGDAYHPYRWRKGGREIQVIFRDRRLSDLIGFVYPRMNADDAVTHFLREVRQACAATIKSGHDAVVGIILDGENAWESYHKNGRSFLRELYSRISEDSLFAAVTVNEGIQSVPPRELESIFPGSWIDSNFDIWIGTEEDNLAWEVLLDARKAFDRIMSSERAASISEHAKNLAHEELLIAEGSDWCWWYGPEHASSNKAEFDQLYRDHLANMYRLLGEDPPEVLALPIPKHSATLIHEDPTGLIQPTIDGKLSSRTEWTGAGRYRIDPRSGAMHSQRSFVQDFYYGSDGQNIYLRIDLAELLTTNPRLEFRLHLRNAAKQSFEIHGYAPSLGTCEIRCELPEGTVTAALNDFYEAKLSMSALHIRLGEPLFLQISIHQNDLPIAAIPTTGELELQSGIMAAFAF